MSIFGSKPKPVPKQSGVPSTTSAEPSSAAAGKPRPPAATATQGTGTTVNQALAARQALATLTETHGLAGQAVGLLNDLTAPKAKDGPNQIDELLQAMLAVMESQKRIEEKVDRLSAVLRLRPV